MPSTANSFANALSRIASTRDPARKEAALLTALQEAAKAMHAYEKRIAKLEAAERQREHDDPDSGVGSVGKSRD